MTESEVMKRIKGCCFKAFDNRYFDEIGVETDEDGDMFFCDGQFCVVLFSGQVCRTPYKAEDFEMIRFKREQEEIHEPYVAIYFKNGDKLYYHDYEWTQYTKKTWLLRPMGAVAIQDEELPEYFKRLSEGK